MKKLIASDYDGTLNRGGVVSDQDLAAIREWRAAGNQFGIITGRGLPGIIPEAERFGIPVDFFICNNGSCLYTARGERLWKQTADSSRLEELVRLIISLGGLHVVAADETERFNFLYEGQTPGGAEHWILPEQAAQVGQFTQADTHFSCEADARRLAQAVNQQLGDYVTAYPNGICVDIVPFGAGKPQGLHRYLRLIEMEPQQAVTVGDNLNDLGMILEFHGYAMESGAEEVVQRAEHTCQSMADLIAQLG